MKRNLVVCSCFMLLLAKGWGQTIRYDNTTNSLTHSDYPSLLETEILDPTKPPSWATFWYSSNGWYANTTYPAQVGSTPDLVMPYTGPKGDNIDIGVYNLRKYTPPVRGKSVAFNGPISLPSSGDLIAPDGLSVVIPFDIIGFAVNDTIPIIVSFKRTNTNNVEDKLLELNAFGGEYLGEGMNYNNLSNTSRFRLLHYEVGESVKRGLFWIRAKGESSVNSEGWATESALARCYALSSEAAIIKSYDSPADAPDESIKSDKYTAIADWFGAGTAENPLSFEEGEGVSIEYYVGPGRDPNGMTFSPAIVEPKKETVIHSSITFENVGRGTVPAIDLNVVEFNGPYTALGSNLKWNNNTKFSSLNNDSSSYLKFKLSGGSGLAGTLNYIPSAYDNCCRGSISYDFKTKNTIKIGNEIKGKTLIQMYNTADRSSTVPPVMTNTAIVKVRKHPLKHLGMFVGLKVSLSKTYSDSASLKQKDFGIALTGRFPFPFIAANQMDWENLKHRSSIRAIDMPKIWWQWELGYSQTPLPFVGKATHFNIDVTPLRLRYMFPKNLNGFPSAFGLSAAYVSSLTFHQSNVRYSSTWDFSADFFNLFGQRGISAGVGYKNRNLNLSDTKYNFSQVYLYTQINLGRFR